MTDKPNTPTLEQVRWDYYQAVYGDTLATKAEILAGFDRWLVAIEAAAEQRGAVKALLKAADAIRGNRLPSGNEHTELCDNCSIAAADHLLDRADRIADQMEGDE